MNKRITELQNHIIELQTLKDAELSTKKPTQSYIDDLDLSIENDMKTLSNLQKSDKIMTGWN